MANEYQGLAELLELNNMNLAEVDATDLLMDAPFLAALSAETATQGTKHSYLVEDGAPVVGFRAVNAGRENKKSSDRLVEITLQILAASFTCDQRVANNYTKGGAPGWMAREAKRHLKAAFAGAEKQIFYGTGTGGDSGGFVGMSEASTVDALADVDHVVNATGTTVGGASSVWAVRSDRDNVQVITGLDGNIEIGDYFEQMLVDRADSTKEYPGYVQPIEGYLGLQVGSAYSMARIVNLTTQAGKGLTDTLMSQLLELFPAGRAPTHFVMNRQSRGQLQRSRTATTDTGRDAPIPTEYQGIPIIVTDQLLKTEALVA